MSEPVVALLRCSGCGENVYYLCNECEKCAQCCSCSADANPESTLPG